MNLHSQNFLIKILGFLGPELKKKKKLAYFVYFSNFKVI